MKTTTNKNIPKNFSIDLYKAELLKHIGEKLEVTSLKNQRQSKKTIGTLEYASNVVFGLRVVVGSSSYVSSFSYADLFVGRITIKAL